MLLQSRCAGCDRPGVPLCRTCRFALVQPARPPVVAAPATGRAGSGAGAAATDRIIAAVPFTGRARDVVLGFKYRNRRQLAAHLAGLLVNRLLADGVQPGVDVDVVTWAPTSAARRRQRGFDQAELVARQVALQLGLRSRRLLERGGDVASQTGLGRVDRLAGPTFRARPDVAGRRVLVIDDVVTTGATLRSAAAALRDAGARGAVLAAVASTPGGLASRRQRWGQVVTGPWADSGTAPSPTPTRRTA